MEQRIVHVPAFTVVGTKYRGNNQNAEIAAMWQQQFMPRVGEIRNRADSDAFYGVMGNYDETMSEFDYVAGVEVTSAQGIPQGMVSWDIPAQDYAVFPCTLQTIGETFEYIYATWLPSSGYQRGEGPEFEYYGEEFNDGQKMSIYVPVVRGQQ